jgi:hypothetical protein
MNAATLDNEPDSAETSPIEPPTAPPTAPHDNTLRVDVSEAALLAREKADAKAALRQTLVDLKQSLRTSVDVRLWTKEHPWIAVGMAAAAGFTAATVVVPAPGEKFIDKLSRAAERIEGQPEPPPAAKPDARTSLAAIAIASLFDLAKVTVEKAIAARAAAPSTCPPSAACTNEADSHI